LWFCYARCFSLETLLILHIENYKSFLIENQFFALNFPETRKFMFPNLHRKKNKKWKKMIKIYEPNSTIIKLYLQLLKEKPNSEQTRNSIVSYSVQGISVVGIIRRILKSDKIAGK